MDATSVRDHAHIINSVILEEEKRVRQRFKWLAWQDTLGCAFFCSSVLLFLTSSYLYWHNIIPWWAATFLNTFATSILHELEHDLIHSLYFKTKPQVKDFMFAVIWISKLHANPWERKYLHLKHHKVSGQIDDVEERLLGLGLPFGLKRLALAVHPSASVLQFDTIEKESGLPATLFDKQIYTTLPIAFVFGLIFHLFVEHLIFPIKIVAILFPIAWTTVRNLMVLWGLPGFIRNLSINLMTTSCHYYGDIPKGKVYFQNQIINHPFVWPFQIFCFNFASTHIIHHYVPSQPFYLRQMIAGPVHEEMVRQGVRKNDFGVIFRSNSFDRRKEDSTKEALVFFAFALTCVLCGLLAVPVLNLTLPFTALFYFTKPKTEQKKAH